MRRNNRACDRVSDAEGGGAGLFGDSFPLGH